MAARYGAQFARRCCCLWCDVESTAAAVHRRWSFSETKVICTGDRNYVRYDRIFFAACWNLSGRLPVRPAGLCVACRSSTAGRFGTHRPRAPMASPSISISLMEGPTNDAGSLLDDGLDGGGLSGDCRRRCHGATGATPPAAGRL